MELESKGDFSIQIRGFHTVSGGFPPEFGEWQWAEKRKLVNRVWAHGCYSAIAPALTPDLDFSCFIVCNLGILLKISTVLQLKEMSENHSSFHSCGGLFICLTNISAHLLCSRCWCRLWEQDSCPAQDNTLACPREHQCPQHPSKI